MDRLKAEAILGSQGLKVKFGKSDGDDFYRRISMELYRTDKHPNRARKEICNFEKSVPYVNYFQLFITKSDHDSKAPRKESFLNEVKHQMKRKKAPSLREIRATAEKLRKDIFVFSRMDDSDEWRWFLFSPLLPSKMNIQTECLAFLRYDTKDKTEFATVEEKYPNRFKLRSTITEIMSMANALLKESNSRLNSTGNYKSEVLLNDDVQHLYFCHKNHFCNWFTVNKSEILYKENELDFSKDDIDTTENWSTAENNNFLKCVSKELYGSEKHYKFLSNNCNIHPGNSDKSVFKRILDVFVNNKEEDQHQLFENAENVAMNSVSDKAINEVATLFNITICVTNNISKPSWEIYAPTNEMWSFDSSILLLRTGRKYFRLRRKGDEFFLCDDVELRPKDDSIQSNSKSTIDILIQVDASSSRRHSITSSDYRHDGLFNQIAEDFPVRVCFAEKRNFKEYQPFSEFGQVMKRKDMIDRCIDHVTLDSQSFYRCLSKEIFGSENFHSYLRNKVYAIMEECLPFTTPKEPISTSSTKYNFLFVHHLSFSKFLVPPTTEKEHLKTPDVVSNKEATDDEIMVASYLFKTPIYVLSCYSDGSSKWIEYNHIGIQPDVENYYRGHCKLDDKARGHYITLLRSSCGHYNRIVPRTKVCNCLMVPIDTTSRREDDSLVNINKNEADVARITRYIEKHAAILEIAMNDWNTAYRLLSEKCHQELWGLSNKTKKLDVMNMISVFSGFVGIALVLIGVAATPLTFGASLALGVTGGVLTGTSSTAMCISGIFGLGVDDMARSQLKCYEEEFIKHSEIYNMRVANSHQAITELDREIKMFFANKNDNGNPSPCLYTVIVPAAMKTSMSVQLPPLVSLESQRKSPETETTFL